jgi:hypothetical protein
MQFIPRLTNIEDVLHFFYAVAYLIIDHTGGFSDPTNKKKSVKPPQAE